IFFFSSRRRHTRFSRDWSSDVCSSDLLSIIRKSLFWDTGINKINWEKQYKAVIQRVFEGGNEIEKSEIKRFYGDVKVVKALSENKRKPYIIYKNKSFED